MMVELPEGGTGEDNILLKVLASIENKKEIENTYAGKWPLVRLLSYKTFNQSQYGQIKEFQVRLKLEFGVRLIVVGGGYGCSKIVFAVKAKSYLEAQRFVLETMRSKEFRSLGVEAEFRIAILDNPYLRVDLASGDEDISSNAESAIVNNNIYINEAIIMSNKKTVTKIKGGVKDSVLAIESDNNTQILKQQADQNELIDLIKGIVDTIKNDSNLSATDKENATDLIEAVSEEVKKEKPKKPLLKSYAGSLKSVESIGSSIKKLATLLGFTL